MSTSVNRSRRMCPVCKTECSVSTVIPIYVRENDSENDNETSGTVSDVDDNANNLDDAGGEDKIDEAHDDGQMEGNLPSSYETATAGTGLRRRRRINHDSSENSVDDTINASTNINTSTINPDPGQNVVEDRTRDISNDELPSRPHPPASSSPLSNSSQTARTRNVRTGAGTEALFGALLRMQPANDSIPSIHNPGMRRTADGTRRVEEDHTVSLIGNLLLIFGCVVLLFLLLS